MRLLGAGFLVLVCGCCGDSSSDCAPFVCGASPFAITIAVSDGARNASLSATPITRNLVVPVMLGVALSP